MSEITIKYERIKWTPSCKASLLLPGGILLSRDWKNQEVGHPSTTKKKYKSEGEFDFWLELFQINFKGIYPPGSKCEALQLGVHLILLYFIRMSLFIAETFLYFDGGWGHSFWPFKSLDINMVYISDVYVYIKL